MVDKEFGSKLKEIRSSSGKTVPEISAYLISLGYKASEKTIYSWESGRSQPTPDAFLDLCQFCNVVDILNVFGYKKSPDTTKAAPEDEVFRIFDALNTLPVSAGLIQDGEDITEKQSDVLIAICRIIDATFKD